MAIISRIGRRSAKVRSLVAAIYFILMTGAVTMVYPFLLMVAGSTKSNVDNFENRIVPGYLTSDTVLYRKYVEGLYNESFEQMQIRSADPARVHFDEQLPRPRRRYFDLVEGEPHGRSVAALSSHRFRHDSIWRVLSDECKLRR